MESPKIFMKPWEHYYLCMIYASLWLVHRQCYEVHSDYAQEDQPYSQGSRVMWTGTGAEQMA